jgi:hypothetical protein
MHWRLAGTGSLTFAPVEDVFSIFVRYATSEDSNGS